MFISLPNFIKIGHTVEDTVFKTAAVCHRRFLNTNFVTIRTVKRPIMHYRGKNVHLVITLLKMKKVHETTTFLLVTLPDIHRFKKFFTDRLNNIPS